MRIFFKNNVLGKRGAGIMKNRYKIGLAVVGAILVGGLGIHASSSSRGRATTRASTTSSTAKTSSTVKQIRTEGQLAGSFKSFAQGDPNKVEAFLKREFTEQGYGQLYVHKNGQTDFLNVGQILTVRALYGAILKELAAVNNERDYTFWSNSAKALLKFAEAPAKKSGHQWITTAPDVLKVANAKGLENIARIKQQEVIATREKSTEEMPLQPSPEETTTREKSFGAPPSSKTERTTSTETPGATADVKQVEKEAEKAETEAKKAQAEADKAEQNIEQTVAADLETAKQETQTLGQLETELQQVGQQVNAKRTELDLLNIVADNAAYQKTQTEGIELQKKEGAIARRLREAMDKSIETSAQAAAPVVDIAAVESPAEQAPSESGKKTKPAERPLEPGDVEAAATGSSWFSWRNIALGGTFAATTALALYNRDKIADIDWSGFWGGFKESAAVAIPKMGEAIIPVVQQNVGAVVAGTGILATLGYVYVFSGKKQDPAIVKSAVDQTLTNPKNKPKVEELVTGADKVKKEAAEYAALEARFIALDKEVNDLLKADPVAMAASEMMQKKAGELELLKRELRKRGKTLKESTSTWQRNALIVLGIAGVVAVAYGIKVLWDRTVVLGGQVDNLNARLVAANEQAARAAVEIENNRQGVVMVLDIAKAAQAEAVRANLTSEEANRAVEAAKEAVTKGLENAAQLLEKAESAAQGAELYAKQSAQQAGAAMQFAEATQQAANKSAEDVFKAARQVAQAAGSAEQAAKSAAAVQEIATKTKELLAANGNDVKAALEKSEQLVRTAVDTVEKQAAAVTALQITADALAGREEEVIERAETAAALATEAQQAFIDASSKSFSWWIRRAMGKTVQDFMLNYPPIAF